MLYIWLRSSAVERGTVNPQVAGSIPVEAVYPQRNFAFSLKTGPVENTAGVRGRVDKGGGLEIRYGKPFVGSNPTVPFFAVLL